MRGEAEHEAEDGEPGWVTPDRVARETVEIVCAHRGLSIHEIYQKGRSRACAAYGRQIAMYLCHVVGGLTVSEICAALKRDRSTVAHACHMIEDQRDRPVFDRQIEKMEADIRRRLKRLRGRPAAPVATSPSSRRRRSR